MIRNKKMLVLKLKGLAFESYDALFLFGIFRDYLSKTYNQSELSVGALP